MCHCFDSLKGQDEIHKRKRFTPFHIIVLFCFLNHGVIPVYTAVRTKQGTDSTGTTIPPLLPKTESEDGNKNVAVYNIVNTVETLFCFKQKDTMLNRQMISHMLKCLSIVWSIFF